MIYKQETGVSPVFLMILDTLQSAVAMLSDSARGLIENFLNTQVMPTGGYKDRSGKADLYYTFYGMLLSLVLDKKSGKKNGDYLETFNRGEGLGFVDLVCLLNTHLLARLHRLPGFLKRIILPAPPYKQGGIPGVLMKLLKADPLYKTILHAIKEYKAEDGGYHHSKKNSGDSSLYGTFLVSQIPAGMEFDKETAVPILLEKLRSGDGGYANIPGCSTGSAAAAASAVTLLAALGCPVNKAVIRLLEAFALPGGGFRASEQAPLPDLLSTATVLFAIGSTGHKIEGERRQKNLEFIEELWDESGGFGAHGLDPQPDCEYTFYGLLALGALRKMK